MTEPDHVDPDGGDEVPDRWPVGFVLIVAAAALYLGYRFFQLLRLAVDWLR